MDECFSGNKENRKINRIQNLNVKGFTAKDIKVLWYKHGENHYYSFYIMKNGKGLVA